MQIALVLLVAFVIAFNVVDSQMMGYGLLPQWNAAGVGYPAGMGSMHPGCPPVGYPGYPPAYTPTIGVNTAESANANANSNTNVNSNGGTGRWF